MVLLLISIETYADCDFPGAGFQTPCSPSGSVHDLTSESILLSIHNIFFDKKFVEINNLKYPL